MIASESDRREAVDPTIVAIAPCPSLRPLEPETSPARVNKPSRRFATIHALLPLRTHRFFSSFGVTEVPSHSGR